MRPLRLVTAAVRIAGGPARLLHKIVAVYRRDGLPGLRYGLALARRNRDAGADLNDYREWVRRYDTVSDSVRARIRGRLRALELESGKLPLISVLMPVYNPNLTWLGEAIDSVQTQLYPNWELCIADDASTDSGVRPFLEARAREDGRIKLVCRPTNGHIAAASNSALALASGEWLALLDQDDLLSEHALFCVAEAISDHPLARLIYSDEDKLDAHGERCAPYFKCDWNLELFHSHNLVSHLGVYHTALVRRAGGFRPGLEGSQDYDLALRCIELIRADQILHIPRVLYHWRMHPGSVAEQGANKPYAVAAGERALNQHFARTGVAATAACGPYGYHVRHVVTGDLPRVSVIVPTRNALPYLRRCIDAMLYHTRYENFEVLVVDNGSDDGAVLDYLAQLRRESGVRVIRDNRPFNFSALSNHAVEEAGGSVIALVNNDTEAFAPDWLSIMVAYALQPGVGAVGARLLYPGGAVQHAGVVLGLRGVAGHVHAGLPRDAPGYFGRAILTHACSAVTAACLVIRKSVYREVGGMDEINLGVAYGDVDFCLRLGAAGYRNVLAADAVLLHHESATRGPENTPAKRRRFAAEVAWMQARWGPLLGHDPAYSPNLTLDYSDCSLAWPPRVEPL